MKKETEKKSAKPAACKCEKGKSECECECCECGKGSMITIMVALVLALAGVGFGVYGMFFRKDAQPVVETKVEGAAYYPTTVSGAQYFLNQILGLPNNFGLSNLSSGDALTENDKAVLIQGVANSSMVEGVECETDAYVTAEEYGALYKKLFGQEFKYNSEESYVGGALGQFSDKPCVCCEAGAENSYYQWRTNLASGIMTNLVVDKVDGETIYGKAYALYDGLFDEPTEPKLSGEFEVKYAKNDGGYYIAGFKYKAL